MGKSPLLTFRSWDNLKLQDLGLYSNNKELMTMILRRLGKKAMEKKLMKPVKATCEGRGVR